MIAGRRVAVTAVCSIHCILGRPQGHLISSLIESKRIMFRDFFQRVSLASLAYIL